MNKRLAVLILLVIGVGVLMIINTGRDQSTAGLFRADQQPADLFGMGTIQIDERELEVQVAATPAARRRGLSGWPSLEPFDGLLLVFPESGYHGIWMPDMYFSLDLIWLNEIGEIVDIAWAVSPASYPQVFRPRAPARYVLEVKAGSGSDWRIGQIMEVNY